MARKIVTFALACMCLMLCMPTLSFADDALGDVSDPTAKSSSSSSSAADGGVDEGEGITLSADNDAAVMQGASFGLSSFSRSQVGSNRAVEGAYRGYGYYEGSSPGWLCMVATPTYAVVYVPAQSASQVGFDVTNESDCTSLKQLICALDNLNASGGTVASDDLQWFFTSDTSFAHAGVTYSFDVEVKPGSVYTFALGSDGTDITDSGNAAYTSFTHADFAQLSAAADTTIVAQPGFMEQLQTFLTSIDYSPLWVTLKTTGTAIVFIFILGLAAAYFSLRIPARAQDIADSIFTIPMVLPPTVCGFLLLLAFGKNTAVGQWFDAIGFPLIFSWQATVLAAVVVAFPLMYRSARGAFENLDPNMMDAARTLGWSNKKIFFKIMLPLSWSSIAAGTVLAFARALGEFGATLFLAGNYLGVTRTIPIAIYFEWMNGNTDVAIFWTIVIIIFSFIVILFINLWSRRTTKYRRDEK